jgi:sortase A
MHGESRERSNVTATAASARRKRVRLLEWLLFVSGATLLAWYGLVAVQAARFQRAESSTLERVVNGKVVNGRSPSPRPKHQLIGRLEIPRVHLSVMVVDGDDDNTLKSAVGHLPETPMPWEFGNSAVAGHRDTFFRPLRTVQVNDRVRLLTPHGNYQYVVSRMRIVEPDDVSVLATVGQSSLTLVTCYPFNYVGNAPKRYIIQADHLPS